MQKQPPGTASYSTALQNNGVAPQTTWTYNQGAMLPALALMTKATGDKKYIDTAIRGLNGVLNHMRQGGGILAEGCDVDGPECNKDQVRTTAISRGWN